MYYYNIIITIDVTTISFFIITPSKCVDENKVVSYIINKATNGSNPQKPDKVVSFLPTLMANLMIVWCKVNISLKFLGPY